MAQRDNNRDSRPQVSPAPQPNSETQPFWDAAAQGKLLIKKCNSCGEVHFLPARQLPVLLQR